MCKGHSIASPFELTYGRAPILTGTDKPARQDIPEIREVAAHEAKRTLKLMTKSRLRHHKNLEIGERVYLWRDNEGWIGPAPIKRVSPYEVSVQHNCRIKTASRNRVRRITTSDEDEPRTEDICRTMPNTTTFPEIESTPGHDSPSEDTPNSTCLPDIGTENEHQPLHETVELTRNAPNPTCAPDVNTEGEHDPSHDTIKPADQTTNARNPRALKEQLASVFPEITAAHHWP